MSRLSILSKLLYIVLNYEKARVPVRGVARLNYRKSVKKSINIMNMIIGLMENKKTEKETLSQVLCYVNNNIMTLAQQDCDAICCVCETCESLMAGEAEVLGMIKSGLKSLLNQINSMSFLHTKKIYFILMSLHNLPRCLFDNENELNIGIAPISEKEAKEIAEKYIRMGAEYD